MVVKEVVSKTKGEFPEVVIRNCVSTMFDSAKQYDNADAVIKQLKIEVYYNAIIDV